MVHCSHRLDLLVLPRTQEEAELVCKNAKGLNPYRYCIDLLETSVT